MNRPTPTNKTNDCAVCGDIKGNCRQSDLGGWLCMTESGAKLFDIVNGYKCFKPAGSGLWATFDIASDEPQKTAEERKQLRLSRDAEEKALHQSGLNADDRHTTHTALLTQLTLHEVDRADLGKSRKLSAEQIEAGQFRSVEAGQTLDLPINPKTPGVGFGGRKLLTRTSGYLVPARDLKRRITGFQIRNRHYNGKGAKYPWLSVSGVAPANLRNGEMPLTFAPGSGGDAVYLAEGLLKPMVAAERLGISLIGASGGNFASSKEQLAQWLERLKPSELILCPDGGDILNYQVMRRLSRQFEFFAELGLEVKILWWGQSTKAGGDIDEISREQFKQADLISWAEFAAKAKKPLEPQRVSALFSQRKSAKDQTPQPKISVAEWARQQKIERDRGAYTKVAAMLGIEANVDMEGEDYKKVAREIFYQPLKQQLNYETRGELISGFASEMMPAAEGRSLLAYNISQGGGKSNNCLIPLALRTAANGGRVLIFVPTRGLAKEFKERLNKRAGEDIAATHLDLNYYSAAIVVSCPESAYKFKGQRFDALLIDEANECLHRIESAELGNAGPQSLAAFRKLLATTKVVAIATAAMSGRTLAAVQTIGGFLPDETQLQRRSRPGTQMTITEYGNFYQWLQRIIEALRSGLRVAIPTGSQGKGRAIDRVLRALFPEKTGIVIDGKATMQNQRSQFLADPDAFLELTKPDWFIYTPVINSGVSIEGKHFDMQFEYATPHEGAQSILQRGERIRSAIGRDGAIAERHIYFSQMGAPTLEAYPDALDWQYWADELADEANAPIGAAAALARALGAEKALKPMQQDAEKFAAMRPNLPYFLALRAFEIIYKKELLHEDWERYGWQVTQAGKPDEAEAAELETLKVLCDKIRIGLIEQQGRTLKKTKTRESEGELDEINNPFQAARAAKLQLEKLLSKDYLAEQDADFYTAWGADKSASNPGVRSVVRAQLLQMAISDPDCWQQIERMKGLKFLSGKPDPDSEQFWHLPELPAAARDIELVSIVSRCPGIADVIGGKTERWTNQVQPVVAAGLYLIAHGPQLAANTKKVGLVRGYQFTQEMAPAALFNKALELMGYRVQKDRRQGSGDRLNIYRLEVEADAVAALEQLQVDGEDGLKLFRTELKAIRAQTRTSIDAAARSQIISKALAWVSEKTRSEVHKAIEAIKRRHAVLQEEWPTKLGDGTNLDVEKLPDKLAQMALSGMNEAHPPPI